MTKSIFLLTVTVFLCLAGYAEVYNGKVMCKETGTPVAYANVGVIGGNVGTTTNEQGNFALQLDKIRNDETLRITCIGYLPVDIRAGVLREQYNGGKPILLLQSHEELKEVTVRPHKVRHARLGNSTHTKLVSIGFDSIVYGKEVGVLMHPTRIPAYIDSVRMNISFCDFDTVFMRLNVYEQVNDSFVNILREPIYVSMSAAEAEASDIRLDLTKYNIAVTHNFMVSLEYIKDLGAHAKMYFCGSLFAHNCYYRKVSQGNWKYFPAAGPAISSYVTY